MFANVVKARVLQGDSNEIGKEVAIKIVRCQESMYVTLHQFFVRFMTIFPSTGIRRV